MALINPGSNDLLEALTVLSDPKKFSGKLDQLKAQEAKHDAKLKELRDAQEKFTFERDEIDAAKALVAKDRANLDEQIKVLAANNVRLNDDKLVSLKTFQDLEAKEKAFKEAQKVQKATAKKDFDDITEKNKKLASALAAAESRALKLSLAEAAVAEREAAAEAMKADYTDKLTALKKLV